MRVAVIIGTAVLMLAVAASAQTPVKCGITAGFNLAKFGGNGWDTFATDYEATVTKKFKFGWGAGAFADIKLGTGLLSLQPEVLYVIKGSKGDVTDTSGSYILKVRVGYVEVPVLVKYNFTTAGKAKPFMFVGPVVAFKTGAKVIAQNPPASRHDLGDLKIDNAKSTDFGLTIGAGLGLAVGAKGMLTLDLRYTTGLTKVFDDVSSTVSETEGHMNFVDANDKGLDFKNNDIRLMVGYEF